MRMCIYCHKGIRSESKLIAVYDDKTDNIWFFCSWGHVIKWYLLRLFRRQNGLQF